MTLPLPIPDPTAKPPRGLILLNGSWHVRWSGFVKPAELYCHRGHHVHVGGDRLIAGSIMCKSREPQFTKSGEWLPTLPPCDARLFVFRIYAGHLFAMDITNDEDRHIELKQMELDEIIEHFGLSFPSRVKR